MEHIDELQVATRCSALGCLIQHLLYTFHVLSVARGLGAVGKVNDHNCCASAGAAGDVRTDGFVNHWKRGGAHLMEEGVKKSKGAVSSFLRQEGDGLHMLNLGYGATIQKASTFTSTFARLDDALSVCSRGGNDYSWLAHKE
eukprot:6464691-Amphidinium_carterae.1